ncbi:MAG: transglycosylase domain-containing protein [Bacteroidota bacterium]
MSTTWTHTDEELDAYFRDPQQRRPQGDERPPRKNRLRRFFDRQFADPRKAQAAFVTAVLAGLASLGALLILTLLLFQSNDLPSLAQLENPDSQLELATVAYTSDGQELARYALENRSWVAYEDISPFVIQALVATEDQRFYSHWGMDLFRTFSAIGQTVLAKLGVPGFDTQGGSTITQQLARNLFNEQIGRRQTVTRKLKEMVTAVQLERRYTKREIIEMYLNTVEFGNNAFGIEAASRTFFAVSADSLNVLQSATLVGMQKATTRYNPVRNPERSQQRRNVVLMLMANQGYITQEFYQTHRTEPVGASFNPISIRSDFAPHFAMYVRDWLEDWGAGAGYNIYEDGLVVFTTINADLQNLAEDAVEANMKGLQSVVDYEWSRPGNYYLGQQTEVYERQENYEPFSYFWSSRTDDVNAFIRESDPYRRLTGEGASRAEALATLRSDEAFMDSLRAVKTRLEAGFVALDPSTGHIQAWVGGKDFNEDKFDKVALARRQPGSTFKPFVYTVAIDNGYSPYQTYKDSIFTYVREGNRWRRARAGETVDETTSWTPGNSGGVSGADVALQDCLAQSLNTCTSQLVVDVGASNVATYARRMGIESRLEETPSLALGTSDVTLLEMAEAYGTLANGGLHFDPVAVTRIEDRFGNVLYQDTPSPREVLSEESAYTVVDMMRKVITSGTGIRVRASYGLGDLDLAGKTGTTQNSADGWFVMMHPDLVMGAWVGFNDRRLTFRTNWWGQGAHNALFIVGDFARSVKRSDDVSFSNRRFPTPVTGYAPPVGAEDGSSESRRVGW